MSVTLNFKVCHQNITRADSCNLVADSLNYAYAHFDFCSSDWDGLIKTAVFTRGQDTYEQILEDDQCLIPWEVLPDGKGIFTVSVFAGNRITTNVVKIKLDASGWSFALESSQPPTEGVYSQILTRLADVEDTVVESAESAAQSATSAAESAQSAEQSMEAAQTAKSAAEEAAASVTQYSKTSESWAVGGTGTRTGEDTDNSKYYAEQAGAASRTAVSAGNTATDAAQAATQAAGSASQSAQTAAEGAQIVQELYDGAVSDITAAKTAAVGAIQTKGDQVIDSIPADYSDLSDDVTQLKADLNIVKSELSATADVVTTTGHASMRYRWQDNSLAIVSSGLYDITKLVPLEGCSGFSADYSLTPNPGNGHAPICFFSATTENTANLVDYIDTVVADYVYSIPTGAEYVGFMVPTGTHPTVTLYTSKINLIEDAVAKLEENGYGCAFPISDLRQTVGISETFYYNTAITPNKTTYGFMSVGGDYSTQATKGLTLPNNTALEAINGFIWRMYNPAFVEIANYLGANGYGGPRHIVAENLSDCSLLAIGDSTVDSDTLTANLLTHFAEQGCTLTLLGTLGDGSATNRNEGRSGWKASDYLTNKTYGGVVNPFYNPSSQTFDFAYYMTNQGYSAPTFVILQLGINDLSASSAKEDIWSCIQTMIDSILDYNSSIKILINLPTTPNSDQSKMFMTLPVYWNRVTRYNQYAQARAKALYAESSVRCSYCHLILDPDEDIRDGVHPKSAGYAKMALEVINQINCWQNGA